jgi:hypothetical protein
MEHLPCELIICILLTLEDFTDLYNAIRTSRTIYAAFLAARIQILSLTLRWTMPRQLLRHALIIPSSVDVSFLQEDSVPTENWLQNYFYTPSEQFSYPLPTDPIFNKVVRLHVIIQRFTKHFCETIAPPVRDGIEARIRPQDLSLDERVRIYRALYRLQLYTNLFPVDMHWRRVSQAWSSFLGQMSTWHEHEIWCMVEYLTRRVSSGNRLSLVKGQENCKSPLASSSSLS